MTDSHHNTEEQESEAEARRHNRKRIAWFVIVFVCVSLALLTSYRYAINTRLNDWYLFQAAKHTTWVLAQVSEAQLEPYQFGKHNPQEIRATIVAWRAGRESATPDEIAQAAANPLSAWERWYYRALEMRRKPDPRINGPRVYFVLRHGLSSRITVVSGMINALESNPEISRQERREQMAPLNEELRQLREQQRMLRAEGANRQQDESRTFSFILVPECGAIEIMAIFLAAVLAFPTSWLKRLIGIVVGTPIMYLVNIFRLSVLAVIGSMDQSQGRVWFNLAHEYVWQAVYIVFVVAVWLIWVEYVVKGKRT